VPPDTHPRSLKRWLMQALAILAACYIGIIIVLLLLENSLLFHPVRAAQNWQDPPNSLVQDVFLDLPDGTKVHGWWCPPSGWQPEQGALLYCHGNAGNLSHRAEQIRRWQEQLGLAVFIFDYPGYGKSDGRPSESGCYAAANAAYDWIVQQTPPERLLIYGGSLGGGIATEVASRRPHRALILLSTFSSIPDMAQTLYPFVPARWLVRNRFDNLGKIANCARPIFMAHGTVDEVIPFEQGKKLFEAAPEPKRFLCLDCHDHNTRVPQDFFDAIKQFLADVESR
jgi:uncharacterized protein